MTVLVTYDVETKTRDGRRRLTKVAKLCKNYGQRVQLSVFECVVNEAQYEALVTKLKKTIDPKKDSVRIYQLRGERDDVVFTFGLDEYVDFDDPLIF
jgi:CRISPR-associated protein Cas2